MKATGQMLGFAMFQNIGARMLSRSDMKCGRPIYPFKCYIAMLWDV